MRDLAHALAPDPGLVDVHELPLQTIRLLLLRCWLRSRNRPTPARMRNFKPALSGEFHTGADSSRKQTLIGHAEKRLNGERRRCAAFHRGRHVSQRRSGALLPATDSGSPAVDCEVVLAPRATVHPLLYADSGRLATDSGVAPEYQSGRSWPKYLHPGQSPGESAPTRLGGLCPTPHRSPP